MSEKDIEILEKATVKGSYTMFKERPLVRENNVIVYGNMDDEYVLVMTIMAETEVNGKSIPAVVLVQITKTDPSLPESDRIVKQDIKQSLAEAFDIGYIWLTKYIGE